MELWVVGLVTTDEVTVEDAAVVGGVLTVVELGGVLTTVELVELEELDVEVAELEVLKEVVTELVEAEGLVVVVVVVAELLPSTVTVPVMYVWIAQW